MFVSTTNKSNKDFTQMNITLDSLQKATKQLATENSKNEGLSGLEYLFADDIEKDDEIDLGPEPAKDEEPSKDEDAGKEGDETPVADALDDLKEVALDADGDEVLGDEAVDLDDEDTVLDLSSGKKEDEKEDDGKKEDEEPAKDDKKDDEKEDKEDEKPEDKEGKDKEEEGDEDKEPSDECNKAKDDAILVGEGDDDDDDGDWDEEEEDDEELNRYEMAWSQADHAWMVVYAHDMEEAQEKFENGEYEFEEADEEDEGNGGRYVDKNGKPVHEMDSVLAVNPKTGEEDIFEVSAFDGDKIELSNDRTYFYAKSGEFEVIDDEEADKWRADKEEELDKAMDKIYEVTDDEIDESALGDAFKSIGDGIKGLFKSTLKGVGVVIAALGGSFLFGLPGLLLAVCIAFGLMSAKECKEIQVDEGLGDIKNKLKAAIKIFKADPKKSKELNDKMLAAKKAGDKEAMRKIADEVKALAGNGQDGKPEAGDVEVAAECGDGLEVTDERHGEFKRSKFKKDKWGDGRRGRPHIEDEFEIDDEEEVYNPLNLVDDEEPGGLDDMEYDDYDEVAEDGDDFKDGPAKALKSIGIEDPEKASEEDLEAAKALLGIEVTEDEDVCKDGKCECGPGGCKECGTKDVTTVAEMRTFLRECNTFKKNPRLRKAVSKFTRMMAESPRRAQALVDQLDHQFKGKPVTERRFCETFVKSI